MGEVPKTTSKDFKRREGEDKSHLHIAVREVKRKKREVLMTRRVAKLRKGKKSSYKWEREKTNESKGFVGWKTS